MMAGNQQSTTGRCRVCDAEIAPFMSFGRMPIANGFLTDNDGGKRERNPRFCGVAGGGAKKGEIYMAGAC